MSIRHTFGFIWLMIITGAMVSSCQVLKKPLPDELPPNKTAPCKLIFVLPPPPTLPGVPQLTPEQAVDRNVSDKILVEYIGTIRRINREWQAKVTAAYNGYRKSCR